MALHSQFVAEQQVGPHLMGLFKKETIKLSELPNLEDVPEEYYVTFIPVAWLPLDVSIALQAISVEMPTNEDGVVVATGADAAKLINKAGDIAKLMITEWNLVDQNDQALPLPSVDPTSWTKIPTQVSLSLFGAMMDREEGNEIPLANATPSSPTSTQPEPATPSDVPVPTVA